MRAPPVDAVTQVASAAIRAQQDADGIKTQGYDPDIAWLHYSEIAAKHGRHSPACRSYLRTLAKLAAR